MTKASADLFKVYMTNQIVPLAILMGAKQLAFQQNSANAKRVNVVGRYTLKAMSERKALKGEVNNVMANTWDTLGLVCAFLSGPGGALAQADTAIELKLENTLAEALFRAAAACGALSEDIGTTSFKRKLSELSACTAKVQEAIFYMPANRGMWLALMADPRSYVSLKGKISRWRKLLTMPGNARMFGMRLAEMHGLLSEATTFYNRLDANQHSLDDLQLVSPVGYSYEALESLREVLPELVTTASALDTRTSIDELRAMLGYFGEGPQAIVQDSVQERTAQMPSLGSQESPEAQASGQKSAAAAPDDNFPPESAVEALDEPSELEDYEFVVYLEEVLTSQELQRYVLLPEFHDLSKEAASAKLVLTNRNAMGPELCDTIAQQWVDMRKDYLRSTAVRALDKAYAKSAAVREARLAQALTSVSQAFEGLSPKDKDDLVKALVDKLTS